MATNLLAPNGLSPAREYIGAAGNYQLNQATIQRGYGSAIGMGDFVKRVSGYVVLATTADTSDLGVFGGVLGYYDTNLQAVGYGLNGSYITAASPPSGVDIQCLVAMDPFQTFIAQVNGGPFLQSWIGQNINFTSGTNGAPNIAGRSTLSLDGSSVATTATLPFTIVQEVLPPTGGGLPSSGSGNPAVLGNTNPWIEVRLNTSNMLPSNVAGVTGPTGSTGPTGPTGPT